MSLQVFSKNKAEVLILHEKTQADLDRDVTILKEWIKKEPHLPTNLLEDDQFLEISLIRNKYSVEKTKRKIEDYCTLKGRYKYLLENIYETIKPKIEPSFFFYVEKLTEKSLKRIIISKVFDEENYDMARDFGNLLTQRELMSRYDYNDGEIIICDYTECSAQFVTKGRVNVMVDAFELALKGHSARMKEIHIVNKWANSIISFAKRLLPEKMRNRIHSHARIDDLKDFIPKSNLPKDYGGELKSLREMQDDWELIFKEHHDLLETAYNTISREDLRLEPMKTEELRGTFRQLTVD